MILATLLAVTSALPQTSVGGTTVTYPADGASFRTGTTLTLTASVDVPPVDAYTVHYYLAKPNSPDRTDLGPSDTGSDYPLPYKIQDIGDFVITARVVPDAGPALGESKPVNVHFLQPNVAPMVSLIAPANNAKYFSPANISLTADAQDQDPPGQGGGIAYVQFYRDGTLMATNTPQDGPTYHWNNVSPGQYDLQAKTKDFDSAAASSNIVHVTVRPPNTRPSVTLSASPGAPYVAPQDFVLTAVVSDTDDYVAKVKFYRGAVLLGTDSTGPDFTWSGTVNAPGTYTLKAVAFDNYGLSDSASTTVTVNGNTKPTATVGPNVTLLPGDTLAALDGSASTDIEGPLTYLWKGPAGVTFADPTVSKTTANFKNATAANYTITLVVTDNGKPALKDSAAMMVTVARAPKIYSALNKVAYVDSLFSYAPLDSGFPQSSYTFTNKAWLAWDTVTRKLTGMPSTTGSLQVAMKASNVAGFDSKTLTITINQEAKITQDIAGDSSIVDEKGTITLSVTAIGTPAPTYQWQFQPVGGAWGNLPATGPSYTIDTVKLASAGRYQVLVRNNIGNGAKSKAFKLIVRPLPKPIKMSAKLVGQTVVQGSKVVMHLLYTGEAPLMYQWFKNGKSLGAPVKDDTDRVFNPVDTSNRGLYRVRISNSVPDSAWSDTATLVVNLRKLPKPKANPPTKSFKTPFTVTISCDTPGTQIYYTQNGKNPTRNSTPYTGPVSIDTVTVNLRAIAYKTGYDSSTPMTETYTYTPPDQLPIPTIAPQTHSFKVMQKFTLADDTAGATLWYSLDTTQPPTHKYDTALTISSTTTVTAVAKKPGLRDSPPLVWTYTKEATLIAADIPTATPPGTKFTLEQDVVLKSNANTTIRFTLDGSDPRTSSTADTIPSEGIVPLTRRAVLKAYAYGANYAPSDTVTQRYVLVPGPIVASPNPEAAPFEKTQRVTLAASPAKASIYYTTNYKPPLDKNGNLLPGGSLYPDTGILLDSTTTITAMAYYDSVVSPEYPFGYTQRGGRVSMPTTVTVGNATTFYDSILVGLTVSTQGADIKYTLNGDSPDVNGKPYGKPFQLDSNTTLQAQAFKDKFLPSKNLIASFVLMPDTPSISVKGGPYASLKPIVLKARSKRTPILYTLNGDDPTGSTGIPYTGPITLNRSATLKAVTVSGNLVSPVRQETYVLLISKDTVLAPGMSYYMPGNFVLVNPEDQDVSVSVGLSSADTLGLVGFDDVLFSLTLSSPAGKDFPRMKFTTPSDETRSLYKVEKTGLVYFISSADTVTFNEGGVYFMGKDVQPPKITYLLPEEFDKQDSTIVRFRVEDNVANLSYDLTRSDSVELSLVQEPFFAPGILEIKMKNKPGTFKPLYLQLAVHDFQLNSYVPDDQNAMMPLSQNIRNEIKGPAVWKVGTSSDDAWDLISIPFNFTPTLKLGDLGAVAGGQVNDDDTTYHRMGRGDSLTPGAGYWVGAASTINSFSHPAGIIAPRGPGKYKIKLKRGWNQVGNPSMERMYWPVPRYEDPSSHTLRDSYAHTLVKGLWLYKGNDRFDPSDTLAPWRGYLVYNYGGDTLVELASQPIPRTGLQKPAAAGGPVLSLSWGRAQPVTLGSSLFASDRAGLEDEAELPARGGPRLRALRDGRRLSCDWVRFARGEVLSWRVGLAAGGNTQVTAPLRADFLSLPAGYEAWAVSESRDMKFRLVAGAEIEPSGLPQDTLLVVAGPAAKLAELGLLNGKRAQAPADFDAKVIPEAAGFSLRLSLPARCDVRARLWDARGARLAEFLPGSLAAGSYRFSFGDFRRLAATPAPGIYFLVLEMRGASSSARMIKKVLLRY